MSAMSARAVTKTRLPPGATPTPRLRWFLPLMAASGVTMSLTAPLEVLFIRAISRSSLYIAIFMLTSALGVIVIDVFGTRFVPSLDARVALTTGLSLFGASCIGMGLAPDGALLMSSRAMQGFGGGMLLGAGLQAAVRVRTVTGDPTRALGRFNAAFLLGGAVGSPGGLLVVGLIPGERATRSPSSSPAPWPCLSPPCWPSRCRAWRRRRVCRCGSACRDSARHRAVAPLSCWR